MTERIDRQNESGTQPSRLPEAGDTILPTSSANFAEANERWRNYGKDPLSNLTPLQRANRRYNTVILQRIREQQS